MGIKKCQVVIKQPNREKAKQGFDAKTAQEEAQRYIAYTYCDSCDLCRLLCPDLCITRDGKTNEIVIDYNWCKGCNI